MATIKLYTDLEQSKKLAEILPNESADMAWYPSYAKNGYSIRMLNDSYPLDIIGGEHDEIPAWSLAALLDVLPDGTNVIKEDSDTENEHYMCTVGIKDNIISTFANNPVDACVEMIVKLNELKLL